MQYRDELHVHIVVKINVQLSVHGAVAHENPGDVRGGGGKKELYYKETKYWGWGLTATCTPAPILHNHPEVYTTHATS